MPTDIIKKNVVVVMTSHDALGDTGKKTGYYLPELAHPWEELRGTCDFRFVSPKGGIAPCDPGSMEAFKEDPICQRLLADDEITAALKNTQKITDVTPADMARFDAVLIPGGHGPMFDLAVDEGSQKLIATVWEQGAVVATVCHGPGALVNVTLSTGKRLIDGMKLTGFSNAEEEAVQLTKEMPFLLEDKIKASGGIYTKADKAWQCHTVVDGKLITGQNPSSATQVGKHLAQHLASLD